MTVRIQREFSFSAGLFFEDEFYLNTYHISSFFNVEAKSIIEQNIALQRAKWFFSDAVDSVVFIKDTDADRIEKLNDLNIKTCLLPEEPYDQCIGILIFTKLNAILEGKLILTDIQVSSDMCDGVSYLHSIEENIGPFAAKGWWNDDTPNVTISYKKNKGKKVVTLNKKINTWDELNLGFAQEKINNSEVLFASFPKKEKS